MTLNITDLGFENVVSFGIQDFFRFAPQLVTDGISSATLQVPLPLNAVVQQFDVVLEAQTAAATLVQNVAQVRANPATASDISGQGMAIVIDFGTPRTVSAVQVPSGMSIVRVTPWIGTGFAPQPAYSVAAEGDSHGNLTITPGPSSSATTVILPSEIRTERLLVEALGNKTAADLAAQMAVVLPEAPSGLELRINGGAPVFTFPGPAQPGPSAELTDQTWNSDGKRIVHLGSALAALTGDPTKSDLVTFNVVLSSKTPGKLKVDAADKSVSYVRRVLFGSDTSKDVVFAEEGAQELPLDNFGAGVSVDSAAMIQQISFTALGNLPPERVLPPVGPDDANLADLLVSTGHATMVRLPGGTGLVELTAIRLPVLAGSGGAEARVVLWQSAKGGGEPAIATPQGASDPAQLSESQSESWITFAFKRAVPLDGSLTYWAALVVSRGQITWPMASSSGAGDPIDRSVLRNGPPAGPWLPLPVPFLPSTDGTPPMPFSSCRGRVRMAGHAAKDAPIAPVLANLSATDSVQIVPTQKGVAETVLAASPLALHGASLRLVSRVAGTVTIRNLDVVSTK